MARIFAFTWITLCSSGGYSLAKDMAQVSVAEIILAVDEPIDATQCGARCW